MHHIGRDSGSRVCHSQIFTVPVRACARVNLNRWDYARFASLEILSVHQQRPIDTRTKRIKERAREQRSPALWKCWSNISFWLDSAILLSAQCRAGDGGVPGVGKSNRHTHRQQSTHTRTAASVGQTPAPHGAAAQNIRETISWSAGFDGTLGRITYRCHIYRRATGFSDSALSRLSG